jgi:hypothetical protein
METPSDSLLRPEDLANHSNSVALLRRIGEELDLHRIVRVYRDGLVLPSAERPEPFLLGEEIFDAERRRSSRPGQPGAREGGEERSAAESWSGCSPSSLLGERGVDQESAADLEMAMDAQAYPHLRVRFASANLVLLEGFVAPVAGLARLARIGIRYPTDRSLPVKSWAWWGDGRWIGPRHTNYGDGSVCAFEIPDGTWNRNHPLVKYLDLVAVWIVRHAFLRAFGRWPGQQVLHTAHERLTDHRPGELCGGCSSGKPYEACHKRSDVRLSVKQLEAEYRARFGIALQLPPGPWFDFGVWARRAA